MESSFWVLFLWRILTVVLPLFLIGRAIVSLAAWRRQVRAERLLAARISRAQERRTQLQQRLQQLGSSGRQGQGRQGQAHTVIIL
jgi:hypothetical protein